MSADSIPEQRLVIEPTLILIWLLWAVTRRFIIIITFSLLVLSLLNFSNKLILLQYYDSIATMDFGLI